MTEAKANVRRFLRWPFLRNKEVARAGDESSSPPRVPLSIQPDPEYLIDTPDGTFEKLVSLIELSDGGVFAVTGVRGAGKSILLNAVIRHFQNRFHTLGLSAPVSASHELEFFLALFRILCESVTSRLRSAVTRIKTDLKAIGRRQARRQLLLLIPLFLLVQAFAITTWAIHLNRLHSYYLQRAVEQHGVAIRQETDYLRFELDHLNVERPAPKGNTENPLPRERLSQEKELNDALNKLQQIPTKIDAALKKIHQNANAFRLWAVPDDLRNEALSLIHEDDALVASLQRDLPWTRYGVDRDRVDAEEYASSRIAGLDLSAILAYLLLSAAVLVVLFLLTRTFVRYRHFLRHVSELGLLSESVELARYLDYELTHSQEAEVSVPLLSRLAGKFTRAKEYKSRAISVPGLTAQYINYVQKILQVCPDKLIICIDELDKVSDLDNVRSILREIKGGLYVKGCFYVVSISEDARQSFESRLSGARDIFESTFDEVISIRHFSIDTCRKLVLRRLQSAGIAPTEEIDRAIVLSAVLSSGIPRDLIRNFRESIVGLNGLENLQFSVYWQRLFQRRIKEITEGLMTTQALDLVRAGLLEELEALARTGDAVERSYEHAVALVEARLRSLQTELEKRADSAKGVVPEGDEAHLKAWLRSWIELKIYLLARRCCDPRNEIKHRDDVAESLRKSYSTLPYSAETCNRLLGEAQRSMVAEGQVSTVNMEEAPTRTH